MPQSNDWMAQGKAAGTKDKGMPTARKAKVGQHPQAHLLCVFFFNFTS